LSTSCKCIDEKQNKPNDSMSMLASFAHQAQAVRAAAALQWSRCKHRCHAAAAAAGYTGARPRIPLPAELLKPTVTVMLPQQQQLTQPHYRAAQLPLLLYYQQRQQQPHCH
jgi:hypothetical protein